MKAKIIGVTEVIDCSIHAKELHEYEVLYSTDNRMTFNPRTMPATVKTFMDNATERAEHIYGNGMFTLIEYK